MAITFDEIVLSGTTVINVTDDLGVVTPNARNLTNKVILDENLNFALKTMQGEWQFLLGDVTATITVTALDKTNEATLLLRLSDLFFLDETVAVTGDILIDPLSNIGALTESAGEYQPFPNANEPSYEAGERVLLRVDPSGRLITSSSILTDEGSFRDDLNGSAINTALTGTLTFTNGSNEITGVGTAFTSEAFRGKYILATGGTQQYQVAEIVDDTNLLLSENFAQVTVSTGASVSNFIYKSSGTGASIAVLNSIATLASGTINGSYSYIYRDGDWFPCINTVYAQVSQRIANQQIYIGLVDAVTGAENIAYFLLDGTSATTVKCVSGATSAASGQQSQTVIITNGKTTASYLSYSIQLNGNQVAFLIDNEIVANNRLHIPSNYTAVNIVVKVINLSAVTNTNVLVDVISLENFNALEISSSQTASPISIVQREDAHTLSARAAISVNTEVTALSYTVPIGRTMYITGYYVETSNRGGDVKIGKTPMASFPAFPGTVDANAIRYVTLQNTQTNISSFKNEDFGLPIKVGNSGDTFSVLITQNSTSSSNWGVFVQYILR